MKLQSIEAEWSPPARLRNDNGDDKIGGLHASWILKIKERLRWYSVPQIAIVQVQYIRRKLASALKTLPLAVSLWQAEDSLVQQFQLLHNRNLQLFVSVSVCRQPRIFSAGQAGMGHDERGPVHHRHGRILCE